MSLDAEHLIERRRLRRRVNFWRVVAGVVALAALALIGWFTGSDDGPFGRGTHIARVDISGVIVDDRAQLKLLSDIAADSDVSAVLLAIDSPGGTTTGGEALYLAIEALKAKKPVVAVYGTIATSAAYMISLACDRVFSRGNTITGSVGVIFQYPEVHEGLAKLGIKMQEIKSGNLKASPSMFAPLDEPGRAVAEDMVREGQAWFLALVQKSRKIDTKAVPGLEAGRIFSGRQALSYKLVDEIGGETAAVAWLETSKNVEKGLKIIDWKAKQPDPFGLGSLGLAGAGNREETVVGQLVDQFTSDLGLQRLKLDGLLSLWQGR